MAEVGRSPSPSLGSIRITHTVEQLLCKYLCRSCYSAPLILYLHYPPSLPRPVLEHNGRDNGHHDVDHARNLHQGSHRGRREHQAIFRKSTGSFDYLLFVSNEHHSESENYRSVKIDDGPANSRTTSSGHLLTSPISLVGKKMHTRHPRC